MAWLWRRVVTFRPSVQHVQGGCNAIANGVVVRFIGDGQRRFEMLDELMAV
jgi:hypothetical protein